MESKKISAEMREVTRREFTAASIGAMFIGMGVTVTGCGGGGSVSGPSPTPAAPVATATSASADKTGNISGNHGHTAIVTGAQLQAGGSVIIDITGGADHGHSLGLSADEVRQVASGVKVSKSSTQTSTMGDYGASGAHEHTVTFN